MQRAKSQKTKYPCDMFQTQHMTKTDSELSRWADLFTTLYNNNEANLFGKLEFMR